MSEYSDHPLDNQKAALREEIASLRRQLVALRPFIEKFANMKTCDEEPGRCYLDSGPSCGAHDFFIDAADILEARKFLASQGPSAPEGT